MIAVKAFLAISLRGIGSYSGAVAGALAVAAARSFIARYWNADARDLIVLAGLVLALVVNPTGVDRTPRWAIRRMGSVRSGGSS